MKRFIVSTILMLSLVASFAIAQYGTSPFGPVSPSDTAYNAATWNGSYLAATQNALRDQIELMIAAYAPVGATYITQTANGTLTNEQAMSLLGTGAVWNTTATGVQSIDPELTAIGNLVSAADRGIMYTGVGTAGMFTLTAYARSFLDDANEATFKATVNLEAGVDYVAYGGALGTPSSGIATNLTGLPLTTGVTGILPSANGGTGVAYFTYEEVTFTPVFADASSGGNASGTTMSGRYTKIGRSVSVTILGINIDTTGLTAGSIAYIRSLPFTHVATLRTPGSLRSENLTHTEELVPIVIESTAYLYIVDCISAGATQFLTVSDVPDEDNDFRIQVTYDAQ